MKAPSKLVKCAKCGKTIELSELSYTTKSTTFSDGVKAEVVFFRCPHCNEIYLVSILDYWGKKLQQKYLKAVDAYRACYNSGSASEATLNQKLNKVETLKDEAIAYQKEILNKYKDSLPEGILD